MDDHDHGLTHDLQTLLKRRRLLGWLGAAALTPAAQAANVCAIIPSETGGPYPGDGSNTLGNSIVNALALSGIVRGDLRASIAGATGVAAGVPLTITLTLVNADCVPLAGYAVYLWHCTQDGNYSMYSSALLSKTA
jgi:protocatechuate 3,4-dioxygenase beta subunit